VLGIRRSGGQVRSNFSQTNKPKTNMRKVTDHKLNGLNDALEINVLDEPGQDGANHVYQIYLDESQRNDPKDGTVYLTVNFQNGPIQEAGVNGISNEALLAVVIDRLRSFQAGQYSCRETACALTHLETSLMWINKRTCDRMARGVEGTNVK